MDEASNVYPNIIGQTQFRLKKITEIKDYFITEIWKIETMSKGFSKHITSFDYFDKTLIFFIWNK